ncbi:MAG: hypothetical protein ACOYEA_06940 [Fermentimonas sp.]|jgi:hypothetical protein
MKIQIEMKRILSLLLLFTSIASLIISCDDDNALPSDQKAEYTLEINPETLTIFNSEGETKSLAVDAKKVVMNYYNDVHNPDEDVVRVADFNISIEGDENFKAEAVSDNEVKISIDANKTENSRVADLIISLKRKPEIKKIVTLRQAVFAHSGNEYSIYSIVTDKNELLPFEVDGGEPQIIEVNATRKLMKYVDGEYVDSGEEEVDYAVEIEGEGFSYSKDGKMLTIMAANNTGYQREGTLKINVVDDEKTQVVFALNQKSGLLSPFPESHVFVRLAEFNIGKTAQQFAISHNNDAIGTYEWSQAVFACPAGYHLPSLKELNTFMPPHSDYVKWGSSVGNVGYAILGDANNRTAYRYEKVGTFAEGSLDARIKITGRYLGNSDVTLETISDPKWWESTNLNDVVKFFPANGRTNQSGKLENVGVRGHYWSSDEKDGSIAYFMSIYLSDGYTNTHYKYMGGAVRCVRD